LGENLKNAKIKVYFVHNTISVEAKEKISQFSEKEYYVPCVRKLLYDTEILPDSGLTVNVVFKIGCDEIPKTQKYTYLNIVPSPERSMYGIPVQTHNPHPLSKSEPTPRPPPIFQFPTRLEEYELIQYYENNQFFVNKEDQLKRNILHYAVQLEFKELVLFAIQRGANINQTDVYNFTPLHMAVYLDNLEIVQILIYHGALNSIVDDNDNSPFYLAVEMKHYEIISFFLETFLVKYKGRNFVNQETMTKINNWLKLMDGCTIYWKLYAIPYLPPITRIVCTAAIIEKNNCKFVHKNEKTEMYSIKISHVKIMVKKLFPEYKDDFPEPGKSQLRHSKSWSGSSREKMIVPPLPPSDNNAPPSETKNDTIYDLSATSPVPIIKYANYDETNEADLEIIQKQLMDVDLQLKKKTQRSKSAARDKAKNVL